MSQDQQPSGKPRRGQKGGPPGTEPFQFDLKQLEGLGKIHATLEEVAAVTGASLSTVKRYLRTTGKKDPKPVTPEGEAFYNGRAMGKASLRRLQWQHAQRPNSSGVQMTIHLSKHLLGETERSAVEHTGPRGGPIKSEQTHKGQVNLTIQAADLAV